MSGSNAAKFTDAGAIGPIRAQAYDSHVRVSMIDTGSGIAPENHAIIFEEFKQAQTEGRDPRSGAGLGLAISRQLLTLMNGRIWVESALGEGSTFSFTLPRADRCDGESPTPQPATVAAASVLSAGIAS
ncbi:MAG: hypothetical protein IPK19_16705 [Chloroflexi bacterium]|nr:hypothetical protein [Chloroflexota bacterium]